MSIIALPHDSFDVVVIDPPWPFATWTERGAGKSPEAQYKTMSWDEIEELQPADFLAPGGIFFMWATFPLLQKQMRIFNAWGLRYCTGGVWAKRTRNGHLRQGPGYIQRSVCEPYLIATRIPCHFNGSRFQNLIETFDSESVDGLAREHSRKPDEFYRRIEDGWPRARRVDIFARQPRAGWTVWGNETEKFSAP